MCAGSRVPRSQIEGTQASKKIHVRWLGRGVAGVCRLQETRAPKKFPFRRLLGLLGLKWRCVTLSKGDGI